MGHLRFRLQLFPCCGSILLLIHFSFLNLSQCPAGNGAEVSEYRLEWGQAEGAMHVTYSGPLLSYEVKGLTPATTYYCRVQVCRPGSGCLPVHPFSQREKPWTSQEELSHHRERAGISGVFLLPQLGWQPMGPIHGQSSAWDALPPAQFATCRRGPGSAACPVPCRAASGLLEPGQAALLCSVWCVAKPPKPSTRQAGLIQASLLMSLCASGPFA